jgi:hypothetical protein
LNMSTARLASSTLSSDIAHAVSRLTLA